MYLSYNYNNKLTYNQLFWLIFCKFLFVFLIKSRLYINRLLIYAKWNSFNIIKRIINRIGTNMLVSLPDHLFDDSFPSSYSFSFS